MNETSIEKYIRELENMCEKIPSATPLIPLIDVIIKLHNDEVHKAFNEGYAQGRDEARLQFT